MHSTLEEQKDSEEANEIISTALGLWGCTPAELFSTYRDQHVAACRQWVYLVLYKAGFRPTAIGRLLGRDHSTVLYGIKQAELRVADAGEDGPEARASNLEVWAVRLLHAETDADRTAILAYLRMLNGTVVSGLAPARGLLLLVSSERLCADLRRVLTICGKENYIYLINQHAARLGYRALL